MAAVAQQNSSFTSKIDFAGANGDAAIEAAARRGTLQASNIMKQNVGGWLADRQRRGTR